METRPNIFEKILYGQKVNNDNIVIVNEKLDVLLSMLSVETEPVVTGADEQ